jgi:hypothetical protein
MSASRPGRFAPGDSVSVPVLCEGGGDRRVNLLAPEFYI